MAEALPQHLKKYIVEQHYDQYTPMDQACWRYIMRQLRAFLAEHAHECYLDGLTKTGIEVESIPRISAISAKLEKFGWRALPVSGFIPPAAFMELQSLGVLPIASAMRTLDHLLYTPAPDIVHEAAGHAPILIHPEFAQYLREYAQVAKKAIISNEDLDLYEAIRVLSDTKENPGSTPEDIDKAQKELEETAAQITHVSEASELSRMNWWTAEYGLIGDLKNPRIFGAGLLSSVGESKWCLSDKVRKIPLSLECIRTTYDITEPQPQLFVTPDFKTLSKVLQEMAENMAFRRGDLEGVQKAIQAKSINTVQLDSGLQISGKCTEALLASDSKTMTYLRFEGPTQLCYEDQQLEDHGQNYHASGFGTALGPLRSQDWHSLVREKMGQKITVEFVSGVQVQGVLKKKLERKGQLLVVTFEECSVKWGDQILFDPSWGPYDLAIGSFVTSVFGGPADRLQFGVTEDFIAARVPEKKWTESEKTLAWNYQRVRDLREQNVKVSALESDLQALLKSHTRQFPEDWLLLLECHELVRNRAPQSDLVQETETRLKNFTKSHPDKKSVIEDGLSLAHQL